MLLQDFTLEYGDPESIAQAVSQALSWGAHVEGYFLCPTPPVVACDDYPSHTVAEYRRHHQQPTFDPTRRLSGHIAAVGNCRCLGPPDHPRYGGPRELSEAVLDLLRTADPTDFLQDTGPDGPFRGTDASVQLGYRLHYCSWHGRGLWLSFRHIYVGK